MHPIVILLLLVVVFSYGGFGIYGGYGPAYYSPVGLIVVVVIVLLALGRL